MSYDQHGDRGCFCKDGSDDVRSDSVLEHVNFHRRVVRMKFLRGGLMAGLSVASIAVYSPRVAAATTSAADADGSPRLVTELLFKSPTAMATTTAGISSQLSAPGWNLWTQPGGALGVQSAPSPDGIGTVQALEGSYPAPTGSGGSYVGASYDISALNTEDVYIEFWAKMPGAKEGCKFVKIFGERSLTTGYANTTFETDFTGAQFGAMRLISFGDGSGIYNDSQDIIDISGMHPHLGTQSSSAVVSTPQDSYFTAADWGTAWHHFRIHVKFNDGTDAQNVAANGEYYLEVDGKVYVDATGLYNRNPANLPIGKIAFFGWAQTDPQPFQLWYYDIRISTGGFTSTAMPDPPADPAVE